MITHTDDPPEQFWEQFYADGARWSGKPNRSLVDEVAALAPGSALDLGCGYGGDAIWLAQQGWRVTAVDISANALEQAVAHAEEAGVADAVDFQRRNLAESFPPGRFDLVTASFLHSPAELPREQIVRDAAAAVAPGGRLLIVGHAPSESHRHADLPTLDQVLGALALPADEWETIAAELRELRHTFRGETEAHTRVDVVVHVRRR
ncbi:class I SAM-dependent methyltransferase [Conexibacter sp. JD483]|uniref:SAM-dependent methyltransferase n=1 Tax=unclassified Conexibacter TaxID=2627773 RepID=UPI0027217F99|nr:MULTISPECIES: class I SAM-dependent methyltransferase [unclassified Conexibacter]MDO8185755.1 class I SAM-dependent methyltransferase [Conexibacter sp. CPCC 205706]MDO8199132.1 class I SAM-dependent methyltransferase [Conexibacter sp. CPCC 205762]MDR9369923.1 class I SAM-dependent methyltransferase [Conexibacter sp. JD483]